VTWRHCVGRIICDVKLSSEPPCVSQVCRTWKHLLCKLRFLLIKFASNNVFFADSLSSNRCTIRSGIILILNCEVIKILTILRRTVQRGFALFALWRSLTHLSQKKFSYCISHKQEQKSMMQEVVLSRRVEMTQSMRVNRKLDRMMSTIKQCKTIEHSKEQFYLTSVLRTLPQEGLQSIQQMKRYLIVPSQICIS